MAHFRPVKKNPSKNKLNTREDKLYFAFRMYDLNGNDYISKEELLAVLTMMVSFTATIITLQDNAKVNFRWEAISRPSSSSPLRREPS